MTNGETEDFLESFFIGLVKICVGEVGQPYPEADEDWSPQSCDASGSNFSALLGLCAVELPRYRPLDELE